MLFLLTGFESNAGNEIMLNPAGSTSTKVLENTSSRLRICNSLSSFNTQLSKTEKGDFIELTVNSYSKTNTIGSPQLPLLSKLIEIPEGATASVRVVSYDLKEYRLFDLGITQKLIPVQAPQSKSDLQQKPLELNEKVYKTNNFLGETIARVEVAGCMRSLKLANLILSPVEYNPVTNTIRVYDNLVVEVVFSSADKLKSVDKRINSHSVYFENVNRNLLNYQQSDANSESVSRIPVKYIIVSDPMFKDALQPFIQWKTKRGFNVIEAYTNDPGVGTTSTSIKAFLQNLYNSATSADPAPTFVLFAGDVTQIPAFNCGDHVSDLYFCEYTGDYLPEVFYGRFSANSVAELLPQINKTLQYEQFLMPDPSYLKDVVLIAGADASHQLRWGNGQVNYGSSYYFNAAHNLVPHVYLQPEPSGSNYSKNVQAKISNGVSYANYSAHGNPEGWADPSFTISDVAKLQNAGKYGLIVGNSCQTSAYDQNSFGEALLRAENKGALGYIGASGLTYWDEDYWWGVGNGSIVSDPAYETTGPGAYDRMFHDHGETRSEWYSTMGQMVFAGNLAVQESNSEFKKHYWEVYCLMGDPSTPVYFGVPSALHADYLPILPPGISTFEVRSEPFATISISKNNFLHGVAETDENGLAVVSIKPFTDPGYADIVITKQNRQPYIDSVKVSSPETPYLVISKLIVTDIHGNNNQLPENGELLSVDITFNNISDYAAKGAYSKLSSSDSYFTISKDTYSWPTIAGDSSISAHNAFAIEADEFIPDMHSALFTIETWVDSLLFKSDFKVTVYTPELLNSPIRIDDSTAGNGNGHIDPGEMLFLSMPVTNTGHSISGEVTTQFFAFDENGTFLLPAIHHGTLTPGATVNSVFSYKVVENTAPGSVISVFVSSSAGPYNSVSNVNLNIGPQTEDFESDFLNYDWHFKGTQPWEISSSEKSTGNYSAKSGVVTHFQKSEMFIEGQFLFNDTISFFRKVSSETGYDFLRFYIDNIELGSWSGNKNWEKVYFPVTVGNHRLSWVYEKDEATSAGLDAAWIDFIGLPAFSQALKGKDAVKLVAVPETICEGDISQLFMFTDGNASPYTYNWTPASTLSNAGIFNPVANPYETTIYSVNASGKSFAASGNITITVVPLPATPYVTVFEDHLVSSSFTGNQWFGRQGTIPGATSQTFFPPTTETYYVIATENGCHSAASNEIVFGITEIQTFDETRLSVYPNPFSSKLYIDYAVKSEGNVKIGLYNSTGIETGIIEDENKSAGNHQAEFDGSNLAAGIYICKILSSGGVEVIKLVKK